MSLKMRYVCMSAFIVALGCAVLPGGAVYPPPAAAQAAEVEPPVNVTADKMEYFSEKNVVLFTGNALAVRGDVTLSARRMEVTLTKGGDRDDSSIDRIVAEENVNFRQLDAETGRERFATGEKGEYIAEGRVIVLSGNPKAWEGKNVMTGKTMTFYVDEHRFVVEGGKNLPVGLTVYPDKEKKDE